jgi:hypothetical protein
MVLIIAIQFDALVTQLSASVCLNLNLVSKLSPPEHDCKASPDHDADSAAV